MSMTRPLTARQSGDTGFRETFDCLWCGRAHQTRSDSDLEGWARLCPDCVGRAGENGFLRFRLRSALEQRAAHSGAPRATDADVETTVDTDAEMKAYYAARAPEYDDWYLRRNRYTRGPLLDVPWHAELDEAGRWLDQMPFSGEIVELAAGTGWWSPLLASKGTLSLYDVNPEPLEFARTRLMAHGLRAHIHVRDAWEPPDRTVDALFCGFWLSHVRMEALADFLRVAGRWLRPGGIFSFIDSRVDPDSGALGHARPLEDGTQVRRLADGREFRITKVHHSADALSGALERAGFGSIDIRVTQRFFLMGSATR